MSLLSLSHLYLLYHQGHADEAESTGEGVEYEENDKATGRKCHIDSCGSALRSSQSKSGWVVVRKNFRFPTTLTISGYPPMNFQPNVVSFSRMIAKLYALKKTSNENI